MTRPPQRRHERGFWLVAVLFASTMAFAAAPAPLYVLYQREDGFGSFVVTLIFAAYGVGVALSLYLAGHLSDRFGRRWTTAAAVALNVVSGLVFLTSRELGWLLVARFVSGVGVGMLTATATAHLAELHRAARPGRPATRAEVVSTAANIGGLALGPLLAGALAQWAPHPLVTPYAVFAVLMVVGLITLAGVPETVAPAAAGWVYRPQQVAVPDDARGTFWAAGLASFVAFAMFGFFASLAPSFVAGTLHHTSHLLAGVIASSVFGSAAVAQVVTAGVRPPRLYVAGLLALATGLVLVIAGILAGQLWLLVCGGLVTGAGAGMTFKAGIATLIEIAPAEHRSEVLSGLFLLAYLGVTAPVILLGALLQYAATAPSIIVFGALLLLLLAAAAVMVASGGRGFAVRRLGYRTPAARKESLMVIGVGIVLLVLGLILVTGAVDLPASWDSHLNGTTLGWILVAVGALAIVLGLVINHQRTRAATTRVEERRDYIDHAPSYDPDRRRL